MSCFKLEDFRYFYCILRENSKRGEDRLSKMVEDQLMSFLAT